MLCNFLPPTSSEQPQTPLHCSKGHGHCCEGNCRAHILVPTLTSMPHTPPNCTQHHGSPQTGATAMPPVGLGRKHTLQSANSAMPSSLWEQQRQRFYAMQVRACHASWLPLTVMLVSSQSNSCTAHASTVRAEAAHAGMVGLARFKR